MEKDFLLISDIHLENKNENEQQFILNAINEKLLKYNEKGIYPIVVCAGDIHNGSKGLKWLERINTQVVYICGNHEFWKGDYEQVIHNLKIDSEKMQNINFLHNDFVILDNKVFIGATLWTDLGEQLNPDLIKKAANIMNDNNYITYNKWYENPENVQSLMSLYPYQIEKMIENKAWNVLIEKEENKKTLAFYNDFYTVYEILNKIEEAFNSLKYGLHSTSSFSKIEKEDYIHKCQQLNSYLENENYGQWLINNQKILRIENIGNINKEQEKMFNRLKMVDLSTLKIIMVSHHMPFLEEILVGRQEWFDEKINKDYHNDIFDNIFNVRKGLEYSDPHYFSRASKGELTKSENLLHIIHYANDGSNNISSSFLKNIDCWVHGHEHSYNYEDVLKNIKLATNPLAYSMAVFTFKNDKIGLNESYKKYHQITDEEKEVKKLTDSFLRNIDTSLTKEQSGKAIDLWALKSFCWDEYIRIHNYIYKSNKKLLSLLLDNPQWQNSMTEKEIFNTSILIDAIDISIDRLERMEFKMNEGVAMRKQVKYSFIEKFNGNIKNDDITHYFKEIPNSLKKHNNRNVTNYDWHYKSLLKTSFFNNEYIELNQKKLLITKKIIDKFKFSRLNEINNKWLTIFDKAFIQKTTHNKFDIDNDIVRKLSKIEVDYKAEEKRQMLDF